MQSIPYNGTAWLNQNNQLLPSTDLHVSHQSMTNGLRYAWKSSVMFLCTVESVMDQYIQKL